MTKPDPAEVAFWALVEDGWKPRGKKVNALRASLVTRDLDEDVDLELLEDALEAVLDDLRTRLEQLDQAELAAMDRVLERKLYDIDRQDIQEFTDGSDDGFLYCRGFIVALGQAFYEAVHVTPKVAIMDAECGEMCYLPAHVYEQRFGAFPDHESGISRESGSNVAGWDD